MVRVGGDPACDYDAGMFNFARTLLIGSVLAATAAGQTPATQPVNASGLTPRDFGLRFDYQNRYWFAADSDQDGRDFAAFDQQFNLRIPLYSEEDLSIGSIGVQNRWQLTGGLRALDVDTSVRIPRSRGRFNLRSRTFPTHLWKPRVGVRYDRQINDVPNPHKLGFQFELSSPSDRPFHSGDEIAIRFNGFYRLPAGERDAWWFYVAVANDRAFAPLVPLPGIAYEWSPSREFNWLIGFPFNRLRAQPTPWLRLTGQYIFPRRIDTELALLLGPGDSPVPGQGTAGWELYTGYEWTNDTFFLHDRRDDDDRLLSFEQRVKLGLRSPRFLDGAASFEVEGGYAFNRFWFEGEDFDDRFDSRIDLADGPYVRMLLKIEL